MQFSNASEFYKELTDIVDNGFDDLRAHLEAIETDTYHGEVGPQKDETEDGEILEEVTDEVTTAFDNCQAELASIIDRLSKLREAIRQAV